MSLEEFLCQQKLTPAQAHEVSIMVTQARRIESQLRERAQLYYTQASLLQGRPRKDLNLRADELCAAAKRIRDKLVEEVEELIEETGSPN